MISRSWVILALITFSLIPTAFAEGITVEDLIEMHELREAERLEISYVNFTKIFEIADRMAEIEKDTDAIWQKHLIRLDKDSMKLQSDASPYKLVINGTTQKPNQY